MTGDDEVSDITEDEVPPMGPQDTRETPGGMVDESWVSSSSEFWALKPEASILPRVMMAVGSWNCMQMMAVESLLLDMPNGRFGWLSPLACCNHRNSLKE